MFDGPGHGPDHRNEAGIRCKQPFADNLGGIKPSRAKSRAPEEPAIAAGQLALRIGSFYGLRSVAAIEFPSVVRSGGAQPVLRDPVRHWSPSNSFSERGARKRESLSPDLAWNELKDARRLASAAPSCWQGRAPAL
jgi:hypothetical protein